VLAAQQPADVREEESPGGVVRVSVRLAELVVHAMVAHPLVDVVLEGHRLENGQQQPQRPLCLVGAVRPQAVRPRRDSHCTHRRHHKYCGAK